MATFNWTVATLEYDLQPAEMEGAVVICHWRCNAEQTEGENTFTASAYGTCGFSPDVSSPDYVPYDQLTEEQVLGWCFNGGVDKDATETSLQANIDGQINPVTASGTPW